MTSAWIFAGHGSQYPGMGRAILRDTEVGRDWLAAAESASGLPLGQLAAQGPARRLADPLVLEPLLAVVSGAYADLLRAEEGLPSAVAAYSAGHVAALYAAGVVDRATCIQIACIRGEELARAASIVPGGMVSVYGLPQERLASLAQDESSDSASLAARNAPTHVVYSGTAAALSRAVARATAAGGSTAPLEVAGPWHSPLLEPCRNAIAAAIARLAFQPARLPVWSTVTAQPTQDPELLRDYVSASVECTVEWHATVLSMCGAGIDQFVEVGAGRTLWGLLGQVMPTYGFTRRYMESERGPLRRRGSAKATIGAGLPPVPENTGGKPLPVTAGIDGHTNSNAVVIAKQDMSIQGPA